jgi:hypothetical protein
MSWRDIAGISETDNQHNQAAPPVDEPVPQPIESTTTSPLEGGVIESIITTLTIAIYISRTHPPASSAARRQRTSIEDGLMISKCMDCCDAVARAAGSNHQILLQAQNLVARAATFIRQWRFASANEILDQMRQLGQQLRIDT